MFSSWLGEEGGSGKGKERAGGGIDTVLLSRILLLGRMKSGLSNEEDQ